MDGTKYPRGNRLTTNLRVALKSENVLEKLVQQKLALYETGEPHCDMEVMNRR